MVTRDRAADRSAQFRARRPLHRFRDAISEFRGSPPGLPALRALTCGGTAPHANAPYGCLLSEPDRAVTAALRHMVVRSGSESGRRTKPRGGAWQGVGY